MGTLATVAKVKFGSVITDSRGTIGGHTYTWTRYGNQLITKPQTAKTKTQLQSVVRNNFGALTKQWWSVLTPTQRTDWRALAAANPRPNVWGDEFPLTGLALYIGINRLLMQAGQATTPDAPADQFVTPPDTAALTITAPATVSLAFTPTPVPTDHVAYLSMSGPLSPGIANFVGRTPFLLASGSGQTSPWNVASAFSSRHGDAIETRQYAVQLAFLNTTNGALSAALTTAAICS